MMTDKIQNQNLYFAAANSRYGFVSFFDDIFSTDELDYLYIIKGGSGTGKSRLMKEVGSQSEARGERVEYFYCSSDPKSLDGIILCDRKLGIIDGTAPHVAEPRLPGCFDEIINLGMFWDSACLRENKEKISGICAKKKELYSCAYSYLAVAGKLCSICDSILLPSVKQDKLISWAERFCKRFPKSDSPREKTRLTESISYLGRHDLSSFYNTAGEHYVIADAPRISAFVFEKIREAARARGLYFTVSYDPLDTKKINGLYFNDSGVSVTLAGAEGVRPGDSVINTERFFERDSFRELRSRVRYISKCTSLMTGAAVDTMKRISELHSAAEEIYISAMDFGAKEEYTQNLINCIFAD